MRHSLIYFGVGCLLSIQAFAADTYKYSRRINSCVNSQGQVGRNSDGTFECADFKDEDWAKRDFQNISFKASKLIGINFYSANLVGANFTAADLTGSSFFKANFAGAIFTDSTKLSAELTKDGLIKQGALFVDLSLIDNAFLEAVISAKFDDADRLLAQGAEIPAEITSVFSFQRMQKSGYMKEILQYFIKLGIDFSFSTDKGGLLYSFFRSIPSSSGNKPHIFIEAHDEIMTLLQNGMAHGLQPEQIWAAGENLLSLDFTDSKTANLILDFFLSIKGITIQMPFVDSYSKKCKSLIGLNKYRAESIELIFTRGFDVNKNLCYEYDTKEMASTFSAWGKDTSTPHINSLRTHGWDFKKIFNGRSPVLDELLYEYRYFSESNNTKEVAAIQELIQYFDLNHAAYLNTAPVTKDTILNSLAKYFEKIQWRDLNRAFALVDLLDAKNLLTTEGKNLLQIVTLVRKEPYSSYPQKYNTNEHIGEVITGLVARGFSVKSGGESLFLRVLDALNTSSTSHYDYDKKGQLLVAVLEAYKTTNTALETVYNNENIIFYPNSISVVEILARYGFDPRLKNAKGQSLYWFHPSKEGLLGLLALGAPLDLFEEIEGKTLFAYLAEKQGVHGYSARNFLKLLTDNNLIDFNNSQVTSKLKDYVLNSNNDLSVLLFEKLNNGDSVPKYRFARCTLNDGSDFFIEDPLMDLLRTMSGLDSNSESKIRQQFTLILVKNGREQVVNDRARITRTSKEFGLTINVHYGNFGGKKEAYALSSKDLYAITLNGQACVGLNQYPADIAEKFRHVYYQSNRDVFFINQKAKTFGIGLHSLGSLYQINNWQDNIWPSSTPLHDQYVIYVNNDDKFVASILFPKAALDAPEAGSEHELKYHTRQYRWPEGIKSERFKVMGASY